MNQLPIYSDVRSNPYEAVSHVLLSEEESL